MNSRSTTRIAAVTGGFGTLGAAVGRGFAAAGWRLALIDRAERPSSELAAELGEHLLVGGVDLTDFDHASRAVDAVMDRYGRLDALINVAGGFRWETLQDGELATWDLMYATNLRTVATMCKAALPALAKLGDARIVNIAAGAAIRATKGMGAYAASKAGVIRLTEALAEEVKDRGVTVNAILPSIIDTPPNRASMPDADFSRWVPPAALAQIILFLTSEAAREITGAAIPVSGRV